MTKAVLRDKQLQIRSVDFDLFFELRNLCFPTYKYKQGNCHNIVHYASMILTNMGIKHRKIWCYAPARFIKYSRECISKPDPNFLISHGNLTWSYHVALLLDDGSNKFVYDFILDENQPLSMDHWVKSMDVSSSKVDLVDPDNYLFYSLKKKIDGIDFKYFKYEGKSKRDFWVSKGLAINETAMEFYVEEKKILDEYSDLSWEYKTLVGNILNFECVFKDMGFNKAMTSDFQEKHAALIEKYRIIYFQNLNKWVEKVEYLDL